MDKFMWEDDFIVPVIELENGDTLDLEDIIELNEDDLLQTDLE